MSKKFQLILIYKLTLWPLLTSCGGDNSTDSSSNNLLFNSFNDVSRAEYLVPEKDPLMQMQWHLKNTGEKYFSQFNALKGEDIRHDPVRIKKYTGLGVMIAISDNGTEEDHPDLKGRIVFPLRRNYTSTDPNLWYGKSSDNKENSSEKAHGTAVTGIISAIDGNNIGVSGVAPRSKVAPFLYVGTSSSIIKDIDQANGPFDIFNFSYGRTTCDFISLPESLISQYKYGVEKLRNGLGAIYIKAAGNEYKSSLADCQEGLEGNYYGNANLEEDHSYPYLIVVAATNSNGTSSSYSSPGSSIWISAPGGEFGLASPAIITTDTTGCNRGMASLNDSYNDFDKGLLGNDECNYTSTMNGTSSAVPILSGAVALILEANPKLSWRDIKFILAKSSRKIDSKSKAVGHPDGANLFEHTYQQGWVINSAGHAFHNWYGFGIIDINAAIEMAENYRSFLPPLIETNWSASSSSVDLTIPDNDAKGVSHKLAITDDLDIFSVQIKFSLTHTYAGDIGVELTSPSGTKSILMNINSNILETNINDALLLTNAFFGESSKGNWTLKVIDGAPDDLGVLNQWKLNIFGTKKNGISSSHIIINQYDKTPTEKEEFLNNHSTKIKKVTSLKRFIAQKRLKAQQLKKKASRPKKVNSLFSSQRKKYGRNLSSKEVKDSATLNQEKNHLNEVLLDMKFQKNEILKLMAQGEQTLLYKDNHLLLDLNHHLEKNDHIKICNDQVILIFKKEKMIIFKNEKSKEVNFPERLIFNKFISCKKNLAHLILSNKKNIKHLFKINLSQAKLAFSKIRTVNKNENIYVNIKQEIIEERVDKNLNLTYYHKGENIYFPKGYAQLLFPLNKSLIHSNKKSSKTLLLTKTTTAITDSLISESAPLLILLEKNKITKMIQLGGDWQLKHHLFIKEIYDIKLGPSHAHLILKSYDKKLHTIRIKLDVFYTLKNE